MKYIIFFGLLFLNSFIFSQDLKGVIKGIIRDKETFQPIIGAKVQLVDTSIFIATVSNINGVFKLNNIPLGKQTIIVQYIGYETQFFSNLDVSSKEVVLEVGLIEKINLIKEVVVTGNKKGETINKMVSVSARSFSIDESKRYAGSLNDVSRMAQNFAGVKGGNDSRNDIIVRGNSPTGVLYRLEGIDIPNPNHFARFGTTGGPVSMLNNNVLANSDFLTGAFPAEYGNATAGVFDLKLRNGNTDKHEFMFQFGFNGAELLAEGPLNKKSRASYLVSYRFNDLSFFTAVGLNIGTSAVPRYQDLSFKLNFPHKKGTTSLFGISGISNIDIRAEKADTNDLYALDNSNTFYKSTVAVYGINHKQRLGKKAYLSFSLAYQTGINEIKNDTVDANFENPFNTYGSDSHISKWTNNTFVNVKLNPKHVIKGGVMTDLLVLNLVDTAYSKVLKKFVTVHDFKGNSVLLQPYIQYQYRASKRLNFNAGLHYQLLALNNSQTIEPRLGARFNITENDKLTIGYGLHSQMQPIELYYIEKTISGEKTFPNQNLDFSKSHHAILGYQRFFKYGIQAKIEFYYQHLFDMVVSADSSSFSMANYGAEFVENFPNNPVNNGLGENYGIDLTIEKYLDKGFYFLMTSSLFQSEYTAGDGNTYSTAFSGNYTFNVLTGYEYKFKKVKKNQKLISLDLKFTRNGGSRYSPILLDQSIIKQKTIRDHSKAFTEQYPDYMRIDIRVGFKIIGKKITQEWALDLQNITNQKNVFSEQYNKNSQSITTTYQTGRLPIGLYRIYF